MSLRQKPNAAKAHVTGFKANSMKSKYIYGTEIKQIMFVAGENAAIARQTLELVEDIVKGQLIEMVDLSFQQALRRGTRVLTPDLLLFVFRHDAAKIARLCNFLSEKDMRKKARESSTIPLELVDGHEVESTTTKTHSAKRVKIELPWDVSSFYTVTPPLRLDESEDEEIDNLPEATRKRKLREADERTSKMTQDEYLYHSECRKASFTYKKIPKFREWSGTGIGTEMRPTEDFVEMMGLLACECVHTVTEQGLKVKEEEDFSTARELEILNRLKRPLLPSRLPLDRKAITPDHVREGFRRMQRPKARMRAFGGAAGRQRVRMSLI